MWLRFNFSLFLPPLYFSLSLSPSIFLVVLFHRSLTASVSLYTSSVSLFPPFSLPFRFPSIYPSFLCVDIFFLFLVYNTFTTMSFFSPSLYPVLLSLSVSIANLPSSLFFVHSSTLSHSHSLAHFLTRSPSHLRQRHLHLLTPHSFSYAYSLAPFLSCRYRLCPTRGLGRVLSSLDNLPPSPLYSVLPSRNRAENLRIEPSRALLSGRKKDRRIGGRYA